MSSGFQLEIYYYQKWFEDKRDQSLDYVSEFRAWGFNNKEYFRIFSLTWCFEDDCV